MSTQRPLPFIFPKAWAWRASPNFNTRPTGTTISGIILHADAANTVASSMDWIRRRESKVSYHILIGRRGDIYALVRPEHRAWHAGPSAWEGVTDCNDYTIGVCLSNRNDGDEPYPIAQRQAAMDVCTALCQHYHIPATRITSHAKVATPTGRKTDPKGLDLGEFITGVTHRLEHFSR